MSHRNLKKTFLQDNPLNEFAIIKYMEHTDLKSTLNFPGYNQELPREEVAGRV